MNKIKALLVIALILPVTLTWGTNQNLKLVYVLSPIATATTHGECRRGTGAFIPVGTAAPGVDFINFTLNLNSEEKIDCQIWTTAPGYTDSVRSEVASFTAPKETLPTPTGLRILPVVLP